MTPQTTIPSPVTPQLSVASVDRMIRSRFPFAFFGFLFSLLFLSSTFCALIDLTVPNLKIPLISGSIAIVFLMASAERLGSVMKLPVSRAYLFMTAWFIIGVSTSVWRGGSVDMMRKLWLLVIVAYFCLAGMCVTSRMVIRATTLLAGFISITALLIVLFGEPERFTGRVVLLNSRFDDPNDIAMMLTLGMPLICFVMLGRNFSFFIRGLSFVGLLLSLVAFGRSGSRGGMLSLAAILVYTFWRVSVPKKIGLMLATLVLGGLAAGLFPTMMIDRLQSIWSDESGSQVVDVAVASRQARWDLFTKSVIMTLHNPVFGVGLGNFAVAENRDAIEQGARRGSWHVTHNSYTEISSEAGIPALIAFCVILVWCWRTLRQMSAPQYLRNHPDAEQLGRLIFALQLTLAGFAVGSFFLSVGYHNKMPTIVGLIAALHLALRDELQLFSAQQQQQAAADPSPARPAAFPAVPVPAQFASTPRYPALRR